LPQRQEAAQTRKLMCARPSNDWMTMLIFAARLNRQFRFVSIVTILQQTAPAFVENETTWTTADATDAKPPSAATGNFLPKS